MTIAIPACAGFKTGFRFACHDGVMHPRDLPPTARTLYWYLQAVPDQQTVQEASVHSGIPSSSIYQQIQRFPELFQLIGGRGGTITLNDTEPPTFDHGPPS